MMNVLLEESAYSAYDFWISQAIAPRYDADLGLYSVHFKDETDAHKYSVLIRKTLNILYSNTGELDSAILGAWFNL
jgi:hypothetical protein